MAHGKHEVIRLWSTLAKDPRNYPLPLFECKSDLGPVHVYGEMGLCFDDGPQFGRTKHTVKVLRTAATFLGSRFYPAPVPDCELTWDDARGMLVATQSDERSYDVAVDAWQGFHTQRSQIHAWMRTNPNAIVPVMECSAWVTEDDRAVACNLHGPTGETLPLYRLEWDFELLPSLTGCAIRQLRSECDCVRFSDIRAAVETDNTPGDAL
jgi:hypothetical protein